MNARVQAYLDAVVRFCGEQASVVSLILFGSTANGGFSETVSDVDLIFVLRDKTVPGEREKLRADVASLELLHGFAEQRERTASALESVFETLTANHRSVLVCSRRELLGADVARIFNVTAAQAVFVDRIVLPSICSSAVTLWGENLLAAVSTSPIRRLDVCKAFYTLSNQVVTALVFYTLLPRATKYAMGALKASVHSCFFCHHGRRAALPDEIDFFVRRYGPNLAFEQLLALRQEYRKSFGFVWRCLPAMLRLHASTARHAPFARHFL